MRRETANMAGERTARIFHLVATATLLALTVASGNSAAPPSQSQVIVEGHRATLERRVRDFVVQITAGPPDASLQRWIRPICPSVAGLPEEQGEAVLARLSQIAVKAGAPLARKQCQP